MIAGNSYEPQKVGISPRPCCSQLPLADPAYEGGVMVALDESLDMGKLRRLVGIAVLEAVGDVMLDVRG